MTAEVSRRILPMGIRIYTMEQGQAALRDSSWQQSTGQRELALVAKYGQGQCGTLLAALVVTETPNGLDKFVSLTDLEISGGTRRIGVGSGLMEEMERHARQFGASRAVGSISADDIAAAPYLPDFLNQLGYQLTPTDNGGFQTVKPL